MREVTSCPPNFKNDCNTPQTCISFTFFTVRQILYESVKNPFTHDLHVSKSQKNSFFFLSLIFFSHLRPSLSPLSTSPFLFLHPNSSKIIKNRNRKVIILQQFSVWRPAIDNDGKPFIDIIYEKAIGEGITKIMINRPERRNAFRPQMVKELMHAFNDARDDPTIGAIILTGKGTEAFCSGGDQAMRKKDGYADFDDFGRLNVLDLQEIKRNVQIHRLPKPVIAMVGHFDAGYGSTYMDHLIGPKKAREMWFLARFYTAAEADPWSGSKLGQEKRKTIAWKKQRNLSNIPETFFSKCGDFYGRRKVRERATTFVKTS
ncbi:hypothetical protein UlMin_033337 [Ulmus minor]